MIPDDPLALAGTIAAALSLAVLGFELGGSEAALLRARTEKDPRAPEEIQDVRAFPRVAFTVLWVCRDVLLVLAAALAAWLGAGLTILAGLVALTIGCALLGAAMQARRRPALRGHAWLLIRALLPFARLLRSATRFAARILTRAPLAPFITGEAEPAPRREEVVLDPEERDLLAKVRAFGSRQVRDVMTPRVDIFSLPEDIGAEELRTAVDEARFSRIPIHREQTDQVVGILYVKDLIGRKLDAEFHLAGLLHPPTVVPPETPVDEVFRELRRRKVHLALVIDSLGTLVGLVTLEDLLEELFGEIRDESDLHEPGVERHGNALLVPGRLPVAELALALDRPIETDGQTTVGGLLMAHAGKIPRVAEEITFDGLRFTVERREGTILRRVRVEPVA